VLEADEQLFLYLNEAMSGPLATGLFWWITHLGNGLVLALLILPAFFFVNKAKFYRHAVPMVLAVALSGLVVNLLKAIVGRPRPPSTFADRSIEIHTTIELPADGSFPSGHTQTAIGAAVYLSCLFPRGAPLFVAIAVLVGLSRIALGVHFPLDVLAGVLFGAGFSIAGFVLNRRRLKKRGQ
jgi:undecaprenyl-diphosphatase